MKYFKIPENDLAITLNFLSRAQLSNVTWTDLNVLMERLKAAAVVEETSNPEEKPAEEKPKK